MGYITDECNSVNDLSVSDSMISDLDSTVRCVHIMHACVPKHCLILALIVLTVHVPV